MGVAHQASPTWSLWILFFAPFVCFNDTLARDGYSVLRKSSEFLNLHGNICFPEPDIVTGAHSEPGALGRVGVNAA